MSRILWSVLLAAPAIAGTLMASGANAQSLSDPSTDASTVDSQTTLKQLSAYGAEGNGNSINQVTSVSQFSDVRPTDWAFQALQSLVERYGCIVGYPNRTYRGNRALSRYEFAAGLNACLDKIQELIAAATADFVKKEDLEVVKKLQEEFSAELAALRGRVDSLEVRTATLEKQQFSTTTKLNGEVIFAVQDTFGDATDVPDRGEDDPTETTFSDRVRLNFDTSFSGKDLLRTRLEAKNVAEFNRDLTGTNMTRTSYDGVSNNGANAVQIDELFYRFPLGKNLKVQIDATNTEFYDALIDPISPFASSGSGSISRFGRFNPTYRSGALGAGISFEYKFSDAFALQGGYIADTNSNDPGIENGLFDGAYSAIGQLVFKPSKNIDIGLSYVRSYYPGGEVNITGSTGSEFARRPFGNGINNSATSADNFAAAVNLKLSKAFILGGWFGYQKAYRKINDDEATVLNWAGYLGFPDLGRKGNLGGIIVGMPPKATDNDVATREDYDTSIHVEGFYRYRINDNISITPGLFVIFNPEHNSSNDTQFVGVVRTTFTF